MFSLDFHWMERSQTRLMTPEGKDVLQISGVDMQGQSPIPFGNII